MHGVSPELLLRRRFGGCWGGSYHQVRHQREHGRPAVLVPGSVLLRPRFYWREQLGVFALPSRLVVLSRNAAKLSREQQLDSVGWDRAGVHLQ